MTALAAPSSGYRATTASAIGRTSACPWRQPCELMT